MIRLILAYFLILHVEIFFDCNDLVAATSQSPGSFLAPNENYPVYAEPILRKAKEGLLVAVGSERVIFHFLMSPQITHVLAIDYDPEIQKFHKINSLLVRAAGKGGRRLYRDARFDFEYWEKFVKDALHHQRISPEEALFLQDNRIRDWWHKEFINNNVWIDFYSTPRELKGDLLYWENDESFDRLWELVSAGRLFVSQIDLRSEHDVLTEQIKKLGVPLSVFDISNAWTTPNLSSLELLNLVICLADLSEEDTIFMVTKFFRNLPLNSYIGVDFELIKSGGFLSEGSSADINYLFSSPFTNLKNYSSMQFCSKRLRVFSTL